MKTMPASSFIHVVVFILAFSETTAAASLGGHRKSLEPDDFLSLDNPVTKEFEVYSKHYGRNYKHGSEEYLHRRGLFAKRNALVKAHNAQPGRLWEAVAGLFADHTEAERSRLLGYKRNVKGASSGGRELPAAAVKEREMLRPIQGNATIPDNFDWMHLRQAKMVPDQGSCGSCWAVASKSVLEAHYEIYVAKATGPIRNFSAQQIVSCVPNPRVCGGTGGCSGSTVELAFDWVTHNGCADDHQVPYLAQDLTNDKAKCNESKIFSLPSNTSKLYHAGPDDHMLVAPAMGGSAFGMHGWQKLEINLELPLLMALYHHGPVATSTAAGPWFEYKSGIFDGCPKDTIVDHAVTLYGFGQETVGPAPLTNVLATHNSIGFSNDPSTQGTLKKYWLIRNSWGAEWGEKGFIRMLRMGTDTGTDDERHCGTDSDNFQGTGCTKDDPNDPTIKKDNKTVRVCGMCGFLWDSVIPLFSDSATPPAKLVELDASGKLLRREPLD